MKILVSGASGYIGSVLVPKLLKKNYSVFGIDRVAPHIDINLFEDFIIDDLNHLHSIHSLDSEIDVIIHLAGESRIDAKSASHHKDNYMASKNLYEWSLSKKINRLIMLSTIKVYNQDSYSESKIKSESLLIKLCKQNNAKYTILRSTLIYGQGMKGGFANWLKRYKKTLVPDVRNSKSLVRMIGVHDLCDAIIFCIENQAVDNKTYEIHDNIDYKIKDIDQYMRSVIGHNKKYILLPRWFLWLLSKVADLMKNIGLDIPFSTDRYDILYNNAPQTNYSFFQQHSLSVKEKFMENIPFIIGMK